MARRRTYDPGEWVTMIEAAGLDYNMCGGWFLVLLDGCPVPGACGVPIPNSGRVPIRDLMMEIERAEAHKRLSVVRPPSA